MRYDTVEDVIDALSIGTPSTTKNNGSIYRGAI